MSGLRDRCEVSSDFPDNIIQFQKRNIIQPFSCDFKDPQDCSNDLNITYSRKIHGYIEVDDLFLRLPYIMRFMGNRGDINDETIRSSIDKGLIHRGTHNPDNVKKIDQINERTLSFYKSGIALLVTEKKCLELFYKYKKGNIKNIDIVQGYDYNDYCWMTKATWGKKQKHTASATATEYGINTGISNS